MYCPQSACMENNENQIFLAKTLRSFKEIKLLQNSLCFETIKKNGSATIT